jgi:hypothetical protein
LPSKVGVLGVVEFLHADDMAIATASGWITNRFQRNQACSTAFDAPPSRI